MDRTGTIASALVLGAVIYVVVKGDLPKWSAVWNGTSSGTTAAAAPTGTGAPAATGNPLVASTPAEAASALGQFNPLTNPFLAAAMGG